MSLVFAAIAPHGTLAVPDAQGNPVSLRVVGLLKDSVFQSQLVMSESNFLRLYPNQEGYSYFLIDTGEGVKRLTPRTPPDFSRDLG